MTIRLKQVNPQGTRVFMGTLTDGADIHAALVEVATRHNIQTATFDLLGGLHEVEFRAFDFHSQQRQTPLRLARPQEIVAGHGTITLLEGQPQVHLHLVVAYQDAAATPHPIVVLAGHASRAIAFAIEFTLTAYDGHPVHRTHHAGTGLMLWDLPRVGERD